MKMNKISSGSGLFQNRAYLALISSQLISNLGDWLQLLALLTMIGLKWQATPWQITIAMLCMLMPMLLGGSLSGMLADRMERKKLMIISDVARTFIVLGMVFVTQLWHVYLLLIAKGIFDIMFSPAKNGKLKEIVPEEHMEKAVSYSAIIEQGTKIIGPALGGMLTVAFGVSICFIIDSASFLLSAIILLGVPGKTSIVRTKLENNRADGQKKFKFWNELAAGIKVISGIPLIAFGTLTLTLGLLVLQIADSQAIVLFREIPGIPQNIFGWCITLSGLGTLVAVGVSQLLRNGSPLSKIGIGGVVLGAAFGLSGIIAIYGPFNLVGYTSLAFIFFVAGLGAGLVFIPFQVMLQKRTPESLTGRVFGTVTSLTSTASILGPICGGLLVTTFGPAPAFIVSGSLLAVIGLLLLLFRPAIMKRDREVSEIVLEAAS
ncbi:MFS transporter [Paenibacillus segetis]|uniref:MFS-type transporter YfiS n=1 Tax=Paenibacillus segetis TaxID=1325360 RepID=A0ABQ1YW65_9BACL|nr:MFS transporter [Paenibacillus segetis]GGH38317.1 putative MFS-type transporter YfiS [Paenibacillus segetis]